jgi:hypothetical protein
VRTVPTRDIRKVTVRDGTSLRRSGFPEELAAASSAWEVTIRFRHL